MDSISAKARQTGDLTKLCSKAYITPVIMMGLFTFLFLCAEYIYVDMMSLKVSDEKAVLAQNLALGVSCVGFLLYPVCRRFLKTRIRMFSTFVLAFVSVVCVNVVCKNVSDTVTFIAGLVLFGILGLFGSGVYYNSVRMLKTDVYLARIAGISYMLGILLQFINNNLVKTELTEGIILSVVLVILVFMLVKQDKAEGLQIRSKDKCNESISVKGAGILLIIMIAFMTCIFSTLDNAVTLVHASGEADIGQLPRILLALSGIAAGFLFDIKKRRYMNLIMYCVMVMSTICIAAIYLGKPFLLGLIIFYVSAGFFAVFFTTSFMELSMYLYPMELWAGMGRAVNNLTAAVITEFSLAMLTSGDSMAAIVLVLAIFVIVSIVMAAYMVKRKAVTGEVVEGASDDEDSESPTVKITDKSERLMELSERYSFSQRETEVFDYLVNTGDSIQVIAEGMYISKRTLERNISSIYEKTGAKSRVELILIYNEK